MATYKSEFYSHYYKGRLRPAAMYAMGLLPWAARAATAAAGYSPVCQRNAPSALARAGPEASCRHHEETPGAAVRSGRGVQEVLQARLATGEGPRPGESSVVIWPDTFTDAFSPDDGADLVEAFSAMGERVAVPSAWACCGRTLYDFGMLDRAKKTLGRLVAVLEPWARAGVPVVVPEPSCLVAFRDELPALLPDDPRAARLASLARSPSEHIVAAGLLEPFA